MATSRVELEVLALVVADRDPLGVVEEDVGRHEHRVGEQPDPHRLLAGALLLELGHPPQLAHGGRALEQPGHPGVLGDVALDEQGAPVGIEAGGQQVQGGLGWSGTGARPGRCPGSGHAGRRRSRRRRGRPGRPPNCGGHPGSSPGGGRRWAAIRTGPGPWGVIVGRCPVESPGRCAASAPLQTVASGRGRHRLHPRLRGSCRPAAAAGQQPPGRHLYDIPLAAVVDAFVAEVAGWEPVDLQTALGVPDGGGRSWSSSSPGACCPGPTRSRPTRSWSAGRSATCCWPGCSSARPTPPPPTSSPSWSSRRPGPCPGSRARPRLRGPRPRPPGGGHPRRAGRRLPPGDRRAARCPWSTSPTSPWTPSRWPTPSADPGPAPTPPGHGHLPRR